MLYLLILVNFVKILSGKNNGPSALFSDGEYIGQIAATKDVRLSNFHFLKN